MVLHSVHTEGEEGHVDSRLVALPHVGKRGFQACAQRCECKRRKLDACQLFCKG